MSNVDYNIKMVEPSKKFALALKSQNFIPLKLENKSSFVEPDKTIFLLNAAEQTNIERNQCTKYRINGKLNIVTDNSIVAGYGQIVPNSAWTPESVDSDNNPANWVLQISYPFEKDEESVIHEDSDSTRVIDGFRIKELLPFNFRPGSTKVLLRTSQKHGIEDLDDFIYLRPLEVVVGPFGTQQIYNYLGYHKILDFEPGNEDHGLILDTDYVAIPNQFGDDSTPNPFFATAKRVFDASSDDLVFANNTDITNIQKCDINGGSNGPITDLRYLKIYSQSHDLRVNNFIDLRNQELDPFTDTQIVNPINNLYKVESTPNPNEFVINYNYPSSSSDIIGVNLKYRYCDGVPSEYYYRKFKIMTKPKDYEIYDAAFATSIYTDNYINKHFLFHFNRDIDVEGLRDNLNRPLSELYLTVAKRASYFQSEPVNTYGGYRSWNNTLQLLGSNQGITPLPGNGPGEPNNDAYVLGNVSFVQGTNPDAAGTIKNEGSSYYGDFVEYNRAFLEERKLSDVLGRFAPSQTIRVENTDPQEYYEGVTPDGYTYNLHQRIEIRAFSENIETTENKANEIFPDYVQVNSDGTVSWRDLLDIGFLEGSNVKIGVDYPFVNSRHYLFNNYPIYIRKQLPVSIVKVDNNKFVKFNTDSTPNDEC